MKRLLCSLLAIALMLSGAAAYARDMMDAVNMLPGSIMEFEAYLFRRVEDQAQLKACINRFNEVGGKHGASLGTYCEVLLYLAQERYSSAILNANIIIDNANFDDYLAELESNYIMDGKTLLKYAQARAAEAEGDYDTAINQYAASRGFFDAWDRHTLLIEKVCKQKYEAGIDAYENGDYALAIECFEYTSRHDYLSSASLLARVRAEAAHKEQLLNRQKYQAYIVAGFWHTVGLKSDGTVVATGSESKKVNGVGAWRDIVAVSAGYEHTVGLKSDGTVVAVGYNDYKQCDVGTWREIVAVSAGAFHTVGLKSGGTVVAVGWNGHNRCDVGAWRDIVAVSAGEHHTVGLKSGGTVVAAGDNEHNQCDVGAWRDIVAISAGCDHTVGLKSDGTVVAAGRDNYNQLDVGAWRDIVAVSAGASYTVGLKSDGTAVAVGWNGYNQLDVGAWRDIVAVSAGIEHTVGLRSDGTVVAAGDNNYNQLDVGAWRDIGVID